MPNLASYWQLSHGASPVLWLSGTVTPWTSEPPHGLGVDWYEALSDAPCARRMDLRAEVLLSEADVEFALRGLVHRPKRPLPARCHPAGHVVVTQATYPPSVLRTLPAQDRHCVCPASGWYSPSGQGEQSTWPGVPEKVCGTHGTQVPSTQRVPALQGWHCDCAVACVPFPTGQNRQYPAWPASRYFPMAHGAYPSRAALLSCPGGVDRHDVAPVCGMCVPASHGLQVAASPYVPRGHAVHTLVAGTWRTRNSLTK